MDNYGTPKTTAIKNRLVRHPRFHVHFTPTSTSWRNQVERWSVTLTHKYIRRGTHRSTRQLEQAIRHYIKVNTDDPKPFVWSKTTDDILASVERFRLRTSSSRLRDLGESDVVLSEVPVILPRSRSEVRFFDRGSVNCVSGLCRPAT